MIMKFPIVITRSLSSVALHQWWGSHQGLKGRVFEVSLADLQNDNDADRTFSKFKLIAEDFQGCNVLTNFHGMVSTTDKLRSMVKKWQTLIEASADVKTTDGYLLSVFCIGFNSKDPASTRRTCYAQHTQVKAIRKKMIEIINRIIGHSDLKEVVNKLLPDSIAKDIEKMCQGTYPLHDVFIRKVKVLKKPRFDLFKLLDLHGDSGKGGKSGVAGERAD
ncbi:40S ribosomal protein S3a-like [Harmonia axyridis]|uniref:40S ribosomal protein S3a-like n=1 Tax=Harmonia axyridis TaxID=115357 RepID=UPI001E278821|nr:40S ribosomal protein S3a-like [Harmonia axyridis]